MSTLPSLRPNQKQAQCQTCGLQTLCYPPHFSAEDLNAISNTLAQPPAFLKHNTIFHTGEPMQALYAVRSGAVKTTQLDSDGQEHILGFHLPGEVIGLDSLGHDHYASNAIALEKTLLCKMPVNQIYQLSQQLPSLQTHLFQLMSTTIRSDYQQQNLLSQANAEQRLISFLLGLSARQARRHLSATDLTLSMSRSDLANHLGLANETVSRQLSLLSEQGLLMASGKHIQLLNPSALNARAHSHCQS